jgi:hypothetical protein
MRSNGGYFRGDVTTSARRGASSRGERGAGGHPARVETLEARQLLSGSLPSVIATAGKPIDAVQGKSTGPVVVATFTDPGGAEPIGDYSATVVWGDGTAPYNGATIIKTGTDAFKVVARHTYALAVGPDTTDLQLYTVRVTVHKQGAPSTPSTFKFVTLDSNTGLPTENWGINDFRVVSGLDFNPLTFINSGVLFRHGAQKPIAVPGAHDTETYQINNAGQIAVSYYGASGIYHSAVYDTVHNKWHLLPDVKGARENLAGGINDTGLVVGDTFANDLFQDGVGWTWQNGKYSFFTAPGSDPANGGTATYSVNNQGQIVGYFYDNKDVEHGYIKTGPAFTILNYPGATSTVAYGINNEGVVVGGYNAGGVEHGFLWYRGYYQTLDVPGAADTFITTINDNGDLGGAYIDKKNNFNGFEALDVPAAKGNIVATTADVAAATAV